MWILLGAEVLGLACVVHLWGWRRGDGFWRRAFWSLVALVPGIGVLLYLGAYTPPSSLAPGERAGGSAFVSGAGAGGGGFGGSGFGGGGGFGGFGGGGFGGGGSGGGF